MPTSEMESVIGDGISFAESFNAFNAASPSGLVGAFWPLLESLWTDGTVRPAAYDAVAGLVSAFPAADGRRQALTALLLGLIAEAEGVDAATRNRIRGTVPGALELLAKHGDDEMLRSALLYLVEHFPEDADQTLAAAKGLNLTAEEASRLERSLSVPDVADKEGVLRVGRTFPAPTVWDIPADELPGVGGWASWLDLDEEKIKLVWVMDADSLRAVDGGRALWLAQERELAPTTRRGRRPSACPTRPGSTWPPSWAARPRWPPRCAARRVRARSPPSARTRPARPARPARRPIRWARSTWTSSPRSTTSTTRSCCPPTAAASGRRSCAWSARTGARR
ncbi:hypothetical protein ACFQ9X_28815 [Catenulispora yoronensis]